MTTEKQISALIPEHANRCPGFMAFMYNAELDPKKSDEENIKYLGIVAARKCIRCKFNNELLPCTINETPQQMAQRHIAQLAARRELTA